MTAFAVLAAVVSAPSCNTDPCGDIGTLDLATNQVCFDMKYTCSAPVTVVQTVPCGAMYSNYAIRIDQGASCTIDITCADGRTETYQAYWATNGTCIPVQIAGIFDGTVCDVDGGVSTPDASQDAEAGD